jgi:hypothetical protein
MKSSTICKQEITCLKFMITQIGWKIASKFVLKFSKLEFSKEFFDRNLKIHCQWCRSLVF